MDRAPPRDPGAYDLDAAEAAVHGVALRTPLLAAPSLEARVGRPVLLKLETLQRTGSFKVRGAVAFVAALDGARRRAGVVACSSGNHGRAVAWAAARSGVPVTVYVPAWVDPVKLHGIRAAGAEAVLAGDTFDEAEARAVADAEASGRVYVSAYDDPRVIAGQGTIGGEIADQAPGPVAGVVAPLSGGGLAGGVALGLRHRMGADAPPVVAASAERAAVMLASVRAGRPVTLPEQETVASALAGGIGADNRWSFALIREAVPHHVTVTEEEIERAIALAYNELSLIVEGGGAVGLAAVLAGPDRLPELGPGALVVVLSGGNIGLDALARIAAMRA